jgi:RNA-directed DNA polymerase
MHNSNSSMNPDRGGVGWRDDKMPALDNLMERILLRENMQQAWQRVRSNQGALGSDGMSLEDFPAYAGEPWSEIRQSLREGRYQPRPVRRVVIPKPHGKGERKLGVPCVIDRVIQQAILQVLTPSLTRTFRSLVSGADQSDQPTEPSGKSRRLSTRDIASWSIWI